MKNDMALLHEEVQTDGIIKRKTKHSGSAFVETPKGACH